MSASRPSEPKESPLSSSTEAGIDVSAIKASAVVEQENIAVSDDKSKLEEKAIETARKKSLAELEIEKAKLENDGLKSDIDARKDYANRIYCLIVWWLLATLLVIILQGFFSDPMSVDIGPYWKDFHSDIHFKLSDSVLLALIGGTTANVLGIFILVVQYLFPKRDSKA